MVKYVTDDPHHLIVSSRHSDNTGDREGSGSAKSLKLWPILYTLVIFGVMVAAFALHVRRSGIFACPGNVYDGDHYLAYCGATAYGDYDHGAFWFDLEPEARKHAAEADVLFVGNSRLAFGFSAPAVRRWFSANGLHYYLLGFSHFENVTFLEPLVHSLHPRARAYIINVDPSFFTEQETGPGSDVMHGDGTRVRYKNKRTWQAPHRIICTWVPRLCGGNISFYRQRETGEWSLAWAEAKNRVDPGSSLPADFENVSKMLPNAERFIAGLGVSRRCVFLTYVPPKDSDRATAAALAKALGLGLISPQLEGLQTFEGEHLAPESAERFVTAFLEVSGPRLRDCLDAEGSSSSVGQPTP